MQKTDLSKAIEKNTSVKSASPPTTVQPSPSSGPITAAKPVSAKPVSAKQIPLKLNSSTISKPLQNEPKDREDDDLRSRDREDEESRKAKEEDTIKLKEDDEVSKEAVPISQQVRPRDRPMTARRPPPKLKSSVEESKTIAVGYSMCYDLRVIGVEKKIKSDDEDDEDEFIVEEEGKQKDEVYSYY